MAISINSARLKRNLEDLGRFGQQSGGGINRETFSKADSEAKQWLLYKITEAGLQARIDQAGNVWGRWGPEGPAVLTGSHIDTVPAGGMFDGALGVLSALECLQTASEHQLPLTHALEMAAFSDEEGAFLSFLGSRAVMGTLSPAELSDAKNMQAVSLNEAMAAAGLSIENIAFAKRDPHEIKAFLELHIEQGPRLEKEQLAIGIVRSIVGIASYWIVFEGETDHAGTTPLELRRDALLGAAEFCLKIHDWVRSHTAAVVTIGCVNVRPGAFNIVPAQVRLALEFRDPSLKQMQKIETAMIEIGRKIGNHRNLIFKSKRLSWDAPVQLSRNLIDEIRQESERLSYPYVLMDSGAGHDAQVLAQHIETGMIFIPSIAGKSHCPQEQSHWSHIHQGAQLLLNCLLLLAR